jgi:hypothetical protein
LDGALCNAARNGIDAANAMVAASDVDFMWNLRLCGAL